MNNSVRPRSSSIDWMSKKFIMHINKLWQRSSTRAYSFWFYQFI